MHDTNTDQAIVLGASMAIYRLQPGAMGRDQGILTAGTPANPAPGSWLSLRGAATS